MKRGSQDRWKPLLWGQSALMPPGCTILCLPNKTLSCNQAVTLVYSFKSLLQQDRMEEITHSPNNSNKSKQGDKGPILCSWCKPRIKMTWAQRVSLSQVTFQPPQADYILIWGRAQSFSLIHLFTTLWAIFCPALLSMGFLRQEYWRELPFPSPGDLPNPGIQPRSPTLQADSLPFEPPGKLIVFYYDSHHLPGYVIHSICNPTSNLTDYKRQ